jgi:UDP-N-acetylmuramoyl-tripeptide--D-alanyl-D-alanine ligase
LGEIQQWTDAQLVGILERGFCPAGICTDSRTIRQGQLFVALRGERFDGHDFVGAALEKGACAALVESGWRADQNEVVGPLLRVGSTLEALGKLAGCYRRRFVLPVIGIVGSAGKTTTKEMIAAVLAPRYRVLKTAGNENNEIGVPRALLELAPEHEAVVLELAARKEGDISYLCSIAQPTIGVLLNIGTAHLEFFGSVEGVAKAKGELLDYLGESLTALINADDRVVVQEVKRTKGRLLTFGFARESQFRGEGLVLDQEGCGHFLLHNIPFDLQVPGRHNAYNALAAAAVGRLLEVPWAEIQQALREFRPVAMRSEILRKKGICVINDSYNANPASMGAALELLAEVGKAGRRRIAVLGDMLELGAHSDQLHAQLGRQAASCTDVLLAIGPLSRHAAEAATKAGLKQAYPFPSREEAGDFLASLLRRGDVVLVKASRAMALERLLERLGFKSP